MATKTKKFGFYLGDTSSSEPNSFFWYDSEVLLYEDLRENYCKIYFDSEDVNRRNDFLKNFDAIISTNVIEHIPKTHFEIILEKFRKITIFVMKN